MTTPAKVFNQLCSYCGQVTPITELNLNLDNGFLLCRDDIGCYNRVNGENAAYIAALEAELAALEMAREAKIRQIGAEQKRLGLPDPVEQRHKAELAKIEAASEE